MRGRTQTAPSSGAPGFLVGLPTRKVSVCGACSSLAVGACRPLGLGVRHLPTSAEGLRRAESPREVKGATCTTASTPRARHSRTHCLRLRHARTAPPHAQPPWLTNPRRCGGKRSTRCGVTQRTACHSARTRHMHDMQQVYEHMWTRTATCCTCCTGHGTCTTCRAQSCPFLSRVLRRGVCVSRDSGGCLLLPTPNTGCS